LLQRGSRVREAVRLPWVLADEHRDLGVLDVAAHVAAEDLAVHPELAGLLLGERVGPVRASDCGSRRGRVAAAKVIALPAAAVIEDCRSAVGVAHARESGGDFGDRRVPVDRFVAAVGTTTHRRGEPVAAVLVVVEAQRLLARVALRCRVGLVAADPLEPATVRSAQTDFDAAVALAEDARGLLPRSCSGFHGGTVSEWVTR